MLKYHVAVCDDEKSDLDGIVQSVQQYDVQGCFDIETYMDGNELLSELQMQKKSFDLLLLDIEMPSNGFQLAQSLIQMEKHPLVVFVTKRHEYAVQGYGIAFRYLVKPLDQTLFAAAMDAVLQELNSKHFTIEYDGVTISVSHRERASAFPEVQYGLLLATAPVSGQHFRGGCSVHHPNAGKILCYYARKERFS